MILFLTFIVILATLVVQGLSLPLLIRWLGVEDDGSAEKEEREARLRANQAALARLNEISEHDPAKADALKRLRIEYEDHIRQVEGAEAGRRRHAVAPFFLRIRAPFARGAAAGTPHHPATPQPGRHQR